MTVRLGDKTLKCTGFAEDSLIQATEWDAWENEAWTKKRTVYGLKRVWTLECKEEGVAWNQSAAKYLREQAAAGNKLTFEVTEAPRYELPATDVYVDSVSLETRLVGAQNIRFFTVRIKEA